MDFNLHRDFSSLDAATWNALLVESITDVPFLRYEYLSNWWRTRGGGEWVEADLALVTAQEHGRLIGVAPLFLAQYDGAPALMLAGSIEISDYLDLIVRKPDLARFLNGLMNYLASPGPATWSRFDWYNLPDSSPTLAALQSAAEARGWKYVQETYRPTPTIALNGGYEAYLASIEKKQRH
jgi:hypothetical protein